MVSLLYRRSTIWIGVIALMGGLCFIPWNTPNAFGQLPQPVHPGDGFGSTRSTTTQSPASPASHSELADLFRRASEAFANRQYEQAQKDFEEAAQKCSGSELSIQCEYFAAVSRWNQSPNPASKAAVQSWLTKAKAFENRISQGGKKIASPAWDQWVEAAHLLLVKADLREGNSSAAEQRLRRLAHPNPTGQSDGEPVSTSSGAPQNSSLASCAWPHREECSPQVWLELGSLLTTANPQNPECQKCFDQAISCCGPDESLRKLATWNAAQVCCAQSKWNDALPYLQKLSSMKLSPELTIQAKLLECKAKKKASVAVDLARELEPLVDIALAGNVPAQSLYDLAVGLAEYGIQEKSSVVLLELVHRFPDAPISIEARVRLSRNAADKKDWKQVVEHARDANQLGCPDSWKCYSYYLEAKGTAELGDRQSAIELYERALQDTKPTLELELTIRGELIELLYQSEAWTKVQPHVQWLAQIGESLPQKPAWWPTFLLRKAELLAKESKWTEAEGIVSSLCEDFPEWSKASEADYLLARCLIAKTEFDAARTLLEQIANNSSGQVPSTLIARAGWMLGETYMMQRRYSDAALWYVKVLSIPDETYWKAACSLQLGLCAELSQDPETAIEWYRNVREVYSETPFAKTAKERLEKLTISSSKQAERIGSGKKR